MPQWRTAVPLLIGSILLAASSRASAFATPAIWLALVLLLRAWRRTPRRAAAPALAVALYAALATGNRGLLPFGDPIYFGVAVVMAAVSLLPFLFDRWIGDRVPGAWATLAFPAAWVAEEYLRSLPLSGPATWGSIAYTQYGNLPLMQLAALTGLWGITFLIAWVASVAELAGERGSDDPTVRRAARACGAVLGIVLLGGGARLALAPDDSRTIRAATVSLPPGLFAPGEMFRIADGRIPLDAGGEAGEKLGRLREWFFDRTDREAAGGARLVAWPEMNLLVAAADEPAVLERARALAERRQIYLSMGMGTVRAGAAKPFENKTVLVAPTGEVLYSYRKSRPVVGWEESVMRAGDGRIPVVATDLGRVSSAICFENDSPSFVRAIGRAGAELWILPANDWEAIRFVHFEMAAFRAVENGTPILRAASHGLSGAFDAWGRVVGVTNHVSGAGTFVVEMPTGHVFTPYAILGDVFAWCCVLGSALLVRAAVRRPGPGPAAAS